MQETQLARSLAKAGLTYLGMIDSLAPLIPPNLASFVNSTAADGHCAAVGLENVAPNLVESFNGEWHRLCLSEGLFPSSKPEFLLAVNEGKSDPSNALWWARVALETEWDLAGAGAAAGVTGNGQGRPEFVMLSGDGNVIARGSTGEQYTDCVLLRNPHRVQKIRELGADMAHWTDLPLSTRDAVARWLEHTRSE
ncbi:hypothetical protein [Streptomyces sp. Je 1-332]|uniref:hypothetical protein n=1 Tax=Streptomyces sp. Je 1-332 TaxID=3231270 RepID=UPI003457567D